MLKYRSASPSCLPCRRMLHLGALIRGLRARAVKVYYCTMVTFVVLSTCDYVTYPTDLFTVVRIAGRFIKPVVASYGTRDTLLLPFVNTNYPTILVPCHYFAHSLHMTDVTLKHYFPSVAL